MVVEVSKDLYARIGVEPDATPDQIKAAFRRAAMACHPDRHPGDKNKEAEFKALNEAYQVLSDEKRRADYDLTGNVEDSEAKLRSEARESFVTLLTNVILLMDDLSHYSPLQKVREQLSNKRVEAKTILDRATFLRDKTVSALSRLNRVDGSSDPVATNLSVRIQKMSQDIVDTERMFRVLDVMDEMVGEYSYRIDEAGFGFSTSRSSNFFGGQLPFPKSARG